MNSTTQLDNMLDLHPAIPSASFVNFIPNCLQHLDDIARFENPDVLVLAADISKKGRDKHSRPPSMVKGTIGELTIAISLR
jgi:hypothetical protein